MGASEDFRLPVPHQGVEHVTARLDLPEAAPRAVYVLAHGAGAPMTSDFLTAIAPEIARAAGIAVLRFNYAYAEMMARTGNRRPPEKRPALDAVHRAALEHARRTFPQLPLLGGGKSLGGRVASLLAADGEPMDGLIFLGYPLHPPGKEDRLRTEHFPSIRVPTLFVQGTRDALARMELVEAALPALGGRSTLYVVEGGDHSFSVLRKSGRTEVEVAAEIGAACAGWVAEALPARGA